MPPPAEALGRGRPLRGGASERVGVEVAELGVDVAFTGCLRASGDGVAGVRSLLGEGIADWVWCRGEPPFGTWRLDSQLRLFLTGSGD